MKRIGAVIAVVVALYTASPAQAAAFNGGLPHSTNSDDTCDIALLPAATLLLPYFEVDLADRNGETTLLTITNVSQREQAALVTLWTDYGFPVVAFNIYLTGYDVQSLNLYDIIGRGQIAPPNGTGFEHFGSPGEYTHNNPDLDVDSCVRLPANLAPIYITRMQQAFTRGSVPAFGAQPACDPIGGVHSRAVGYATVDIVRRCDRLLPSDFGYSAGVIAFDNVLIGEFMQVNGVLNYAQGNPLVHIRAIPEGGTFDSRAADPARYQTNTPTTFYGRFQSADSPRADGRQPLPSAFVARWVSAGAGRFETSYKIWREGLAGPNAVCAVYPRNAHIPVVDLVLFDEEENGVGVLEGMCLPGICTGFAGDLPATSLTSIDDDVYPKVNNGAVAGWLYLNLHHTLSDDDPAAQAWVVTSLRNEGRFSVDADATPLGNGCTPPIADRTAASSGPQVIGPPGNVNP